MGKGPQVDLVTRKTCVLKVEAKLAAEMDA